MTLCCWSCNNEYDNVLLVMSRVLTRKKMKGGGGLEKIFMSLYPLRMDVTLLSL